MKKQIIKKKLKTLKGKAEYLYYMSPVIIAGAVAPTGTMASGNLIEVKPIVEMVIKILAGVIAIAGFGGLFSSIAMLVMAKVNDDTSNVPKAKGMLPWAIGGLALGVILFAGADKLAGKIQDIVTNMSSSIS